MGADAATAAAPREPSPLLRRLDALLAGLGLQIWPFWIFIVAWKASSTPGIIWALVLLLLPPAPAAGIWHGRRWAYVMGQYLAGLGAIGGLLIAILGQMPAAFIPGAIHAALFFALSQRTPKDPADKSPAKDEGIGGWTRENVEAIAVAFIMALVIRCFCIEVFQIPSSSMEPTLLGHRNGGPDARQGDRIMVTKFYYAATPVERYDVVVFKFPLDQSRNFIKRVVGLPEEELFVEWGNLYTRPLGDPSAPFTIARRPLRIQQSIWMDAIQDPKLMSDNRTFEHHWSVSPVSDADEPYAIELTGDRLRTLERRGAKGARFTWTRNAQHGGHNVGELKLAMNLELRSASGFFRTAIENAFGQFTLTLSPSEPGSLTWRGVHEQTAGLKHPTLSAEEAHDVELLVYDGVAIAIVDGRVEAEIEFLSKHGDLSHPAGTDRVWFETEGVHASIGALTLGHDTYYRPASQSYRDSPIGDSPETAIKIPADHFLMMGDNVGNSHDSRGWSVRTFRFKEGGRVVRAEGQSVTETDHELEEWAKAHGVERKPDLLIKADEHGFEVPIWYADLVGEREEPSEPAPFVHRKFIVGKGLWIWWPPGRWGRLIR